MKKNLSEFQLLVINLLLKEELRQSLVFLMLICLVAGLKEYISSWQISIMKTNLLMLVKFKSTHTSVMSPP